MKVTRNVILDLLPMYLAGEVSADTRALVEAYQEEDPEFASVAKNLADSDLPKDIPIPLKKEDQMEAYREAKRLMFQRTLVKAVVICVVFLGTIGFMAVVWFGAHRALN